MRYILKALPLTTASGDQFISVNYNSIRVNSFDFQDIEKALTNYHFSEFKVHNVVRIEKAKDGLKIVVNII